MNRAKENYERLRNYVFENNAALFGVADMKYLKESNLYELSYEIVKDLHYGISIAFRLSDKIIDDIRDHPTKLYFYHYRQVNYFLDRLALGITSIIQNEGYNALPIPASQTIDWETQHGHISHKEIAVNAGLGWFGKNNLLVNPLFGARIRLVTILTDFPLEVDKPLKQDCGECKKCINCCPCGAIKEDVKEFNHRACFEQLEIFRKKYNIGHHICGICIKVCKGSIG